MASVLVFVAVAKSAAGSVVGGISAQSISTCGCDLALMSFVRAKLIVNSFPDRHPFLIYPVANSHLFYQRAFSIAGKVE